MSYEKIQSPLVRDMLRALQELRVEDVCLRVSVADQVSIEQMAEDEHPLFVRWMCWGFERDGVELTEPQFEVLGREVTAERLRQELPGFFDDDLEIVVDNDIEM